jgi:uncharacterized membrane protein YphA (DoxX/SURF4 family)
MKVDNIFLKKLFKTIPNLLGSKYTYDIIRLLFGTVFIYAGAAKIVNPKAFANIISQYNLVPEILLAPVAIILPLIEILAGIGLILNVRGSLTTILSLLIMFVVILWYGIIKDLDIDCGCFSAEEMKGINNLRQAFYRDIIMIIGVFYLYAYKYFKNDRGVSPNKIFTKFKEVLG